MSRHRNQPRTELAAAIVLCGAAIGLMLAPASMSDPIRATVRDALRPGHRVAVTLKHQLDSRLTAFADRKAQAMTIAKLRLQLQQSQLAERRIALDAEKLRQQVGGVEQAAARGPNSNAGEPLLIPELLEATVVGREEAKVLSAGPLVDNGSDAGLVEDSLVLESTQTLLDHGETSQVEPDLPVYAGRAVLGKIARTGRWVSTVRLVTDAEYRGEAQLVRRDAGGLATGARGVLCGTGEDLCRLKWIASTEPVNVGDEVYTDAQASSLPQPMYYGKVVRAEAGLTHWEIWVEPATTGNDVQTVQVLRRRLNPLRVVAN